MNKVFGLLAVLILAISTWLTFSHHLLAQKINAWQTVLNGDDNYYPALTIFILSLPPLLLLFVVKKLMLKWVNKNS